MPTSPYLNQTAQGNIYWVENETHAKNYPIAFNSSVVLLDKNSDLMYIKSVDNSGVMTGFRKFELNEIVDFPAGDYVPKKDFEDLQAQVEDLKAQLENSRKYNKIDSYNRHNNRRSSNGE